MSWVAVAVTFAVGSSAMAGMAQRNAQKAQTEQIEMTQRSQASALAQAEEDKKREIDMEVYQQERESRRTESMAKAGQANAGIAGITATRQIDNVVFQNMLDVNYIRQRGDNTLIGLSNQGFSQASELQSALNTSKRNTPSNLQIGFGALTSGVMTYASTSSRTSKTDTTSKIA